MRNSIVLEKLKDYKNKNLSRYKLNRLGVFGSVLSGKFDEDSDIDIVVDQKQPDMFDLINIKNDLEEIFGRSVDVVRYRNKMNEYLKNKIDSDAIYV